MKTNQIIKDVFITDHRLDKKVNKYMIYELIRKMPQEKTKNYNHIK